MTAAVSAPNAGAAHPTVRARGVGHDDVAGHGQSRTGQPGADAGHGHVEEPAPSGRQCVEAGARLRRGR